MKKDIFGDSGFLHDEFSPDVCFKMLQLNTISTHSLARQWQSPRYQTINLNQKEREKLTQGLNTASSEFLLQRVVDHISEESHLQQFHEREELMTSLLDSNESEMRIIHTSIAKTVIILYKMWLW